MFTSTGRVSGSRNVQTDAGLSGVMSRKKSSRHITIPRAEELELIRRAADDPEAFGEIYSLYVRRIYNYIYYRIGNHHDAQDLTARVFYRALKHVHRYEDRGIPFSAWLYRIAHNLVANWHRDLTRRPTVAFDNVVIPSSGVQPESAAINQEERTLLLGVVRQLPEDRQQLLILKFIDHLSNAEIGEIMGKTEGAIKSLYHRTLVSLRKELLAPVKVDMQSADEE